MKKSSTEFVQGTGQLHYALAVSEQLCQFSLTVTAQCRGSLQTLRLKTVKTTLKYDPWLRPILHRMRSFYCQHKDCTYSVDVWWQWWQMWVEWYTKD